MEPEREAAPEPAIAIVPDEPEREPEPDEPEVEVEAPRIAVSPTDPRRLALWTEHAIRWSEDDGASFAEILVARDPVFDVAIAPTGSPWTLRGARVGRRERGEDRWQRIPARIDVARLADIQPRIAVSSQWIAIAVAHQDSERLADAFVSRTRGASWAAIAVDAPMSSASIGTNAITRLAIDARGRLRVDMSWGQGVSCAMSYETVHRARAGAKTAPASAEYDDQAAQIVVAHDGWAYGLCYESGEEQGCVHAPLARLSDGSTPTAEAWVAREDIVDATVVHSDATFGQIGEKLVSLAAGHATTILDDLPSDSRLVAVDAGDRAIVERNGQLLRREQAGAWTTLTR